MMVGARTGAWAKSGYTARDYVQDGLIAMWDGIENAGWGAHDPNATTWKDLVGSYDAVLSGCSFSENSLVSITVGSKAKAVSYPSSIRTIEIVFKRTGGGKCVAKFGYYNVWRYSKDNYYCYPSSSGSYSNNGAFIDESIVNSLSHITLSSERKTFANSVLQTLSHSDYWSNAFLEFFGREGNYSTGEIFCARIYDVILTASEIAANYEIDKARFNLS